MKSFKSFIESSSNVSYSLLLLSLIVCSSHCFVFVDNESEREVERTVISFHKMLRIFIFLLFSLLSEIACCL